MKKLKKILIGIIILIVLLSLGGYLYLKSTAPIYQGEISLPILEQQVETYFDDFGVPHIYAKNAEDAYRTLGYVHAQDRLFQMEMLRRLSAGRLSEILGPDLVETDKYFRTLGLRRMAEKSANEFLSSNDAQWQKEAHAYIEGVNEYIKSGKTPLEFALIGIPKTAFEDADIYSIIAYMGLGFTTALKEDHIWTQISEKLGSKYSAIWFDDIKKDSLQTRLSGGELSNIDILDTEYHMKKAGIPIWYGSNGWVVSKEKSKSGSVILSNDTHIGIGQPSVWYEAHINFPGFEFYGNYLAGVPFGIIGHNRKIGWGLTIFPFDNMDLYREKQNTENENQVWADNQWQDLQTINELIKVKESDDVVFDIKISRHGPIMNNVSKTIDINEDQPISLWWTYLQNTSKTLKAIQALGRANNINVARKAVSQIDFLGVNVLYGDVDGNIAFWGAGKIPKRPDHVNSKYILDGSTDKDAPLGYYSFAENPQHENPESGFVASANNAPDQSKYGNMSGYYLPENRILRIRKYLNEKTKWSAEEMKAIQLDEISDTHKMMANTIVSHIDDNQLSELHKNAKSILSNWDGGYELNQIGPVVFAKTYYRIIENCTKDELGAENFERIRNSYTFKGGIPQLLSSKDSPWWDDISTKDRVEQRTDIINQSFLQTINELKTQLGTEITEWKWKKVHTITNQHPLSRKKPLDKLFNVGPFSLSGGNDVPNKMMYSIAADNEGNYSVTSAPALRIILDFADIDASESILPTGQSGNFMSAHYADQAERYLNGVYRPQLMNEKIIKQESRKLVFVNK